MDFPATGDDLTQQHAVLAQCHVQCCPDAGKLDCSSRRGIVDIHQIGELRKSRIEQSLGGNGTTSTPVWAWMSLPQPIGKGVRQAVHCDGSEFLAVIDLQATAGDPA